MVESEGLYGWLLARQPPGLRALGRFWGAVGLTLGVGTAVLGYLGPPKTVAILTPDVSTTLALDHSAASKSEIAMAEPSSIAITETAASSARRSVPPSPAPENTAGPMVWPAIPGFAGVASDPQQSIPAGSPRVGAVSSNMGPVVEAPRRLRLYTGGLEIARPESPDGDTLNVTIHDLPRGLVHNGTAVLKIGDRLRPEELAALVFVPEPDFSGPAGSLQYRVEDSHGGWAESVVEIDVIGAAEAATQLAVPSQQALATASATTPASPPRVVLASSRGAHPIYRVGESMTLRIQPTQDAYVYCYYQDEAGEISRIYPNRFQPNAFVPGHSRVEVPPAGRVAFSIRFEQPGMPEQVACLAADREVGLLLPLELRRHDLKPLPVRGLDEVAQRFRSVADVPIDDVRLSIKVTR